MDETDADLIEVVRLELRLLDPICRADQSCVASLLDLNFAEHGASGRVWTRDTAIAGLAANPRFEGKATNFDGFRIAPDVILLTYSVTGLRPSLRSSIWLRDTNEQWHLRFHQGTLTA
jgi:ribonuclease HI